MVVLLAVEITHHYDALVFVDEVADLLLDVVLVGDAVVVEVDH